MRNKKWIAILMILVLSITMLAACGNKDSEKTADDKGSHSAANEDTELTKIIVALDWTPNTNHTGLYVAQQNGYFEEEGLSVEIIEASDAGAEAMVGSNTAQFGISFQDTLVPVYAAAEEERLPITTVAAIIQHNTSGIISPKDKGIKTPAGMAGNTYATWDLPIEQAIVKQVVTDDGGNYDEINLASQYVENIQGAFEGGIDAVWIYYAWDGINTELAGLDTNFFYFKDYGDELDYYSPVIIANDSFLETEPETAKKFLAAVSKGYEYAIENPEEAAQILVDLNEGLDLELCTASQKWLADQYQADADKWGEIDQSRWDAFYNWVYENDLCENEIPAGFGFTNAYLPE